MKTLHHPNLDRTEVSVPEDEAEAWIAVGWLAADVKPEPSTTTTTRSTGKPAEHEGDNA